MISEKEMARLQDECLKFVSDNTNQPNLSSQIAGISMGHPHQLIEHMDKWFEEMQVATSQMPAEDQYSPVNPPTDALTGVQFCAAMYLAYDKYRPRKKFFFAPSKTAAQRELHALLDKRAQLAAAAYKMAVDLFKSLDEFHGVSRKK